MVDFSYSDLQIFGRTVQTGKLNTEYQLLMFATYNASFHAQCVMTNSWEIFNKPRPGGLGQSAKQS